MKTQNMKKRETGLARRHRRVRGKISGTASRPRMCVTRSNNNIYVQVIDDVARKTICGVSTLGPEFKATGKKAIEAGITEIVFDRGGHLYHGRVKAVADAAREAGLKF